MDTQEKAADAAQGQEQQQQPSAKAQEQAAPETSPYDDALSAFQASISEGEEQAISESAEGVISASDAKATSTQGAEETKSADTGVVAGAEGQADLTKTEYYAKLAEADRRERLLRRDLKEREAKLAEAEKLHQLLRERPIDALQSAGIGLDRILEAYAGDMGGTTQPAGDGQQPQAQETIPRALLERMDKLEKFYQEQQELKQQNARQEIVRNEVKNIGDIVASNTDKYEYINATKDEGSLELVLQTAVAIYERDREQAPWSEVLELVENNLRQREVDRLKRLRNMSFLKSYLTSDENSVPSTSNGDAKKAGKPSGEAKSSPTLSSGEDTPTPRELTDDERFELAKKAFIAEIE